MADDNQTPQKWYTTLPAILGGVTALIGAIVTLIVTLRPSPPPQTTSPQSPPQIINFAAYPTTIKAGEATTLKWQVADAESVQIENGMSNAGLSGEQSINLTETTTFTLLAKNEKELQKKAVTVQVEKVSGSGGDTVPAPVAKDPPRIDFFGADAEKVNAGDQVMLYWNVFDAKEILIVPVGKVEGGLGSCNVTVKKDTKYRLTAANDKTSSSQEIEVRVFTDKQGTPSKTIIRNVSPALTKVITDVNRKRIPRVIPVPLGH
jgi:hypothetical protein